MPRKSTKSASASGTRSSSKRPAQDTPTRQSKRARATARKSYAEPASDGDDDEATKKPPLPSDDESAHEASDFEEQGDGDLSSESGHEEAPTSDEDVKPKKASSRVQAAKKSIPLHSKHGDEKELWKPGTKLAPGTQLIIKKPKARGTTPTYGLPIEHALNSYLQSAEAGDTPYTDETIHPNTMLFLKDLAANNDRQWLKCTSTALIMLPGEGVTIKVSANTSTHITSSQRSEDLAIESYFKKSDAITLSHLRRVFGNG
jgi:hypothetical protein